jgi:hypothetical protein
MQSEKVFAEIIISQDKGRIALKQLKENFEFFNNPYCRQVSFKKLCRDVKCESLATGTTVELDKKSQRIIINRSQIFPNTLYYLEVKSLDVDDIYIIAIRV